MRYEQLIIYYFSGTGNAKNAAVWIIQEAQKLGLNTRLVNIDRLGKIEDPELNEKTLVGFCSPTHGFNLPPIMLKFLWNFPGVKGADAFILNTRGGLKLSRFFLPGVSGIAQIMPALMLWMKGFRIVGLQPLDMPSNWLLLHPGLRQKVVHSIYMRCKLKVENFASKILAGQKKYKALLSLPIDIALIPVAIGYYFAGRFFLAKTLIATDACNSCEKCIIQCPINAIKMVNNRPFWTYHCESCMRCVNNCQKRAIETTQTFSISLIIISSLIISPLLITLLNHTGVLELVNRSVFTKNTWELMDTFIFIMFVFGSYRILHFLMRYKFISRIIAFTSFSNYSFWRRYKAPDQE